MSLLKPRSKNVFLRILRPLKITPEVKSILADLAVEIEGAWYDALVELRTDTVATLLAVERELKEHDTEYQHVTSPEVKEAVQRLLGKLRSKPKRKT